MPLPPYGMGMQVAAPTPSPFGSAASPVPAGMRALGIPGVPGAATGAPGMTPPGMGAMGGPPPGMTPSATPMGLNPAQMAAFGASAPQFTGGPPPGSATAAGPGTPPPGYGGGTLPPGAGFDAFRGMMGPGGAMTMPADMAARKAALAPLLQEMAAGPPAGGPAAAAGLPQMGPGGALPPQFAAMASRLAGMPTSPPPYGAAGGSTPPGYGMGGAQGGLDADGGRRRLIADALARQGQYGDTMLAHINQREYAALRMAGGVGTPNPSTGLPQFYTDDDVSRGSSFAGEDPSGNPNPDPTLKEPPSWGERLLDKIRKNPGLAGYFLGGLGGAAGGPMGGALGSLVGLGAGLGGKALGLWGSDDATSGKPSSYTAGGIPAYNLDSTSGGGGSGFSLAKLGLLSNLF